MEIDSKLLRKVASVARLELTDDEVKKFLPELKEVLNTFSELDSINTDGVSPSYQPIRMRNRLRKDEVTPSLPQDEALKNAVHKKDGFFMGPRAV